MYPRARCITLWTSCLVLTISVASVMPADRQDALHPTMQSIFQALTSIFPLSLNEDTFAQTANRQHIEHHLRTLAQHAATLTSHGNSVPPSFDFLQRTLSRDAQDATDLFQAGHFEEARFRFHQLIDNCFLCHSQLPSTRSFGLGLAVLELLDLEKLPTHGHVRIAVAARQFDIALMICERLFQSLARIIHKNSSFLA